MKKIQFLIITTLVLLLQSCGTATFNRTFSPQITQLHLLMSDLEYVGETEIEVTYSSYLGFIKNIHTVNGIEYDGTQKQIARLDPNWNGSMGKLDHATYKVLQQFPEARYFQVMRRTKVKERLFDETKKAAKKLLFFIINQVATFLTYKAIEMIYDLTISFIKNS